MSEPSENKTQHLHILMAPSEVEAIDEWGFNNRIRTRAEAIRRLCQIGLVFDDHRAALVNRFQALTERAGEGFKHVEKLKAGAPFTELEVELLMANAEIMRELAPLISLIRTTTGIANNFKSDRSVEDIMNEAEEIVGTMSRWLKDVPPDAKKNSPIADGGDT